MANGDDDVDDVPDSASDLARQSSSLRHAAGTDGATGQQPDRWGKGNASARFARLDRAQLPLAAMTEGL